VKLFRLLAIGLGLAIAGPMLIAAAMMGSAHAAEPTTTDMPAVLRVGTKEAPPFVERRADGTLDGPSIRLWRELAEELGLRYELQERDLAGLLDGVRDGSLDVAVAAITVTAEREATIDFTHPFHSAGLGLAVYTRDRGPWAAIAQTLLSADMLRLIGALALLQLAVGTTVWSLERRRNPEMFPQPPVLGIFSGFWWSIVTMTTVGYGDKAPRTGPGRVVALAWMLCSVVIISTFTATVASRMTVNELETGISGPRDLDRARVGLVSNTTSERWARNTGLDFQRFDTLEAALDAASVDAVDVVVHDAPLLERSLQEHARPHLELLPVRFQRQDYAIALPEGSPLRERINRLLPEKVVFSEVADDDGG
jgi:ABC-type amino acid transport substrate-binding protein